MSVQTLDLTSLRLSDYKVHVLNPTDMAINRSLANVGQGISQSAKVTDVTPLVTSISWSYDIDNPIETYTIKFARARNLYTILQRGFRIYIHAWRPFDTGLNYGVLKAGIIWDTEASTTSDGEITVVAHDLMIYLANNKSSHRMQVNEKASDFIVRILKQNGIPVDTITDTQIELGPFGGELFINRTLMDMCQTCLQYTRDLAYKSRLEQQAKQFGSLKFLIRSSTRNPSKVEVIEKKEPHYVWMFNSGNDGVVMEASNKFSLDNYRNVVKIYNRQSPDITQGEGGVAVTDFGDPVIFASAPQETPQGSGQFLDTDGAIAKYGILSESVDFTGPGETGELEPDIFSQAQWQAEDYLRRYKREWQSGTLTSFNINTLRAGDPIWVAIPQIAMIGKFYIKSGEHTVTGTESKMVLTVNFEDFLPFVYRSQSEVQTGMIMQSY